MSDYLPEDVIVKILTNLPVKSLIRFISVSKRWRSIIMDQQFAKSYYKKRPANRRLLTSTHEQPMLLKSIDLETVPSFGEDIRKLTSPFIQPINPLGSANGLVCLTETEYSATPYIWNPSTGMLQRLPHPGFSNKKSEMVCGGFGYLSATDDYKVVVGTLSFSDVDHLDVEVHVEVFSLRARVWKRIQPPTGIVPCWSKCCWRRNHEGLVLNGALHWLCDHGQGEDYGMSILALDLATDQFRTMRLPNFLYGRFNYLYEMNISHIDVNLNICVSGGCLYLFRCERVFSTSYDIVDTDSVELWIMSEYGMPHSWTKLYNYGDSNQFEGIAQLKPILVMETSTVVEEWSMEDECMLGRLRHEESKPDVDQICDFYYEPPMIVYEETLLWIHDYYGEEENRNEEE